MKAYIGPQGKARLFASKQCSFTKTQMASSQLISGVYQKEGFSSLLAKITMPEANS